MPLTSLSADSKRYLQNRIRTPDALDIVMLLRSSPQKYWEAPDVAEALKLKPILAGELLRQLYHEGVLHRATGEGNRFIYGSGSPYKERCLDEIEAVFAVARREVIEFLHASQQQQLPAFSDALHSSVDGTEG